MPRSARETALGGGRFSRRSCDRGGNPLACACGMRGPPRYGMQGRLCFTVGRGPVPRRASICTGNGFGWRSVFAQVERSRGEPARMRVWHARAPALRYARPPLFHRRARACPSPCLDLHGKWPWSAFGFRAGRVIAGETLSHARVACKGPRATVCKAASVSP